MKVCALVGASDFNADHFVEQDFDTVIAVDGGFEHLASLKQVPDKVIGDFDSLGYVPTHPRVETYPTHKDESDIEIALTAAMQGDFDEIILYGCVGGRVDFTYAVIQLIVGASQAGHRVYAVGVDSVITALVGQSRGRIEFDGSASGTLSLLAFTEWITGVDEVGLEYGLEKASLSNVKPLGISNKFRGVPSSVSLEEGTALVFFSAQAWNFLKRDGC